MNNSLGPFLPHLQRYQKQGVKQEPSPNALHQPLQMLHQPIPSIVVNPLGNSDQPSQETQLFYPPQGTLPPPPQQGQKQPPVSGIPVYNLLAQPMRGQRTLLLANNFPMPYNAIHNQPPVYYLPLSQIYPPQYRPQMAYPENFVPMPHMKLLADVSSLPPPQAFPVRQQPASLPVTVPGQLQMPSIPGAFHPGTSDQADQRVESKTHYKPLQTKKNSRPKIKKINSDSHDRPGGPRKRSRISVEEPCYDSLYEHFREVLGITMSREEISGKLSCGLEDELEKVLFELFTNNLSSFIDVYLAEDVFRKIISELALGDETRMILDSMFCLSSLILQRTQPNEIDPLCPLKYYQRTVNSIRYHLSLPEVENPESGVLARCLLSTCLLCIYELFFVAVDITYNKGAASILMSILSKNQKSESLLKTRTFYATCFWAMFVCDMVLSLKMQKSSMFSVSKVWRPLDPEYFDELDHYTTFEDEPKTVKDSISNNSSYVVTRKNTILWQRKILVLYGSMIEFLYLTDVITKEDFESNKRYYLWQQLCIKLEEVERNMPLCVKPLIHVPHSEDQVFPLIYFEDEHAAITALHFKLSKLAMIESLYANLDVENTSLLEPEYAKFPRNLQEKISIDILGILQTYDSNKSIWPVNVHSVRQASRCIRKGTQEHKQLKVLARRVVQFSHALALLVLNDI